MVEIVFFCHFVPSAAATAAKSLQSCPTLCDSIDGHPPGSPVPGILQARILEWVAISFSNAWKWKVKVKLFSHVRLLAIPWTAAYQAPPSMRSSRQEYWSGLPLPSPSSCQLSLIQSNFCLTRQHSQLREETHAVIFHAFLKLRNGLRLENWCSDLTEKAHLYWVTQMMPFATVSSNPRT